MRIACWIIKVTNICSEYVILIAFPRQQWLGERASKLTLYIQYLGRCVCVCVCVCVRVWGGADQLICSYLSVSSYLWVPNYRSGSACVSHFRW